LIDPDIEKRVIVAPVSSTITEVELREFIDEIRPYKFRSVIVDEYYLDLALQLLRGSGKRVGIVFSYPHGGMTTETKVRLTEIAVNKGSDIIVPLNMNAIKSGDYKAAMDDLKSIISTVHGKVDVIALPQVAILTLVEIAKVCDMILEAGTNIVKTNTGLGLGETLLEHVEFIKRRYKDDLIIEISGGIRNLEQAREFVKAGADRIHTSSWKQVIGLED